MNSVVRGLKIGFKSFLANWRPAVALQMIMILIGVSYGLKFPWTIDLFQSLEAAKKAGGIAFSFIAGAVTAGILSEVFRVYFVDGGKWKKAHGIDMLFKIVLYGGISVLTDYFYQFQASWFGSGTDWATLNKKAAVDMLAYSLLITSPTQSILFLWKEEDFKIVRVLSKISTFSTFFGDRFLPFWLSNICFWLPVVYVIYSMPPLLQMPLNLIAATIWGILIVTISRESSSR